MTIYLIIPLLVVVALLQATVIPHLTVLGVFPDLPVIVVVCWGLLAGAREGLIWGFIAGVAVDLLAGAPFGAATLALSLVGFLSGMSGPIAVRARFILAMLVVFLATIVYDLLFMLIVQISGQAVAWLENLARIAIPSAALNAMLTPIILGALHLLRNRFGREEMEW